MAAWGDIAVGVVRPSFRYPSKSAILGLTAACLGIKREQESELQKLQTQLQFAVRVDQAGQSLFDYHTAKVPTVAGLKKMPHYTRRDENNALDSKTIVSSRAYCLDSLYTIALWQNTTDVILLTEIKAALEQPKFTPYLGRKSCPLALPMIANIYKADFLEDALKQSDQQFLEKVKKILLPVFRQFNKEKTKPLYTDLQAPIQTDKQTVQSRRDHCHNRSRWQFQDRYEQQIMIKSSE